MFLFHTNIVSPHTHKRWGFMLRTQASVGHLRSMCKALPEPEGETGTQRQKLGCLSWSALAPQRRYPTTYAWYRPPLCIAQYIPEFMSLSHPSASASIVGVPLGLQVPHLGACRHSFYRGVLGSKICSGIISHLLPSFFLLTPQIFLALI